MKIPINLIFFYSWRRLWRPDVWPEGSSTLWLRRRSDTLLILHFLTFVNHHSSFVKTNSFPLHRGWWWDLLQSGWHHHQHRDDWRGLVEGTVSRAHGSLPGSLCSADAVSDRLRGSLNRPHFCTISGFIGFSTKEHEVKFILALYL